MSNYVDWSSELSVGIEQIDDQHKKLVELVNEMHEAIQQRRASEVTLAVLDELILYTRTHFQTEEALMSLLEYDDYVAHKALHDALMQQVDDLKAKLACGKASVNFELMHFLKQWLTKHIMGDDAQMAAYLLRVKKTPRKQRSRLSRLRLAFRLG